MAVALIIVGILIAAVAEALAGLVDLILLMGRSAIPDFDLETVQGGLIFLAFAVVLTLLSWALLWIGASKMRFRG